VGYSATIRASLAEQPHQGLAVPGLEVLEGAVFPETAVGNEEVSVWISLQEISSRRDGDHDSRPDVRPELPAHVLGQGFGATLADCPRTGVKPRQ